MKGVVMSAEEAMAAAAHVSGVELAATTGVCETCLKDSEIDTILVPRFEDAVAAGAVELAGRRFFLSTAQPDESISSAASMRLPLVCGAFSYSIGNWPVFACSTVQELLDTIIQSYKVAESRNVLLPALVVFDGPRTVREPVQLPGVPPIKAFLGKIRLPHSIDKKKPVAITPSGDALQLQKAAENVVPAAKSADETWRKKFRRDYGLYESFWTEDAETIVVAYGFHAPTAKTAVESMRKAGKKIGFVRLRLLDPVPQEARKLLDGRSVIAFDSFMHRNEGFAANLFDSRSVIFEKYISEEDVVAAVQKSSKSRLWLR